MRLVIDLQACQTDSRDRGIGRYAMSLVQAIASELDEKDELVVAIDMANVRRARDVRNELRRRDVCAKVVGYGYPATQHTDTSPMARRLAGQLRSQFYVSLRPDVLLICSLFEAGTCYSTELDWAMLANIRRAVVGYDLIPLLFPDRYLPAGHVRTEWYRARLADLGRFDLILSISDATRWDLIDRLGIAESRVAVIGAGFDGALVCPRDKASDEQRVRELGIERPFVLMVGNGDWRKNTLGALRAFDDLPESLRDAHDLVLTQAGDDVHQALSGEYAHLQGRVHILGRVDDATLVLLYRECRVFYFPSYYEGFGFPVLEAMAFGASVLSSSAGSLSEVAHDPRSLFDPDSHQDGVALLTRALGDKQFREDIRRGAREHALEFTWKKTAQRALNALRELSDSGPPHQQGPPEVIPPWPGETEIALMAEACMEAGEPGEAALENGLRATARGTKRRVLVDITEIVRLDAKTGIQRVTRNFFAGLASISRESSLFEVEPFCWTEQGVRYAREYARGHLGVPSAAPDEPAQVEPSDLVFMLDSSWLSPERFDDFHARVHVAGGEVVWMVYDLIPIRFPQTCDPGMPPAFKSWSTHAVRTADGFVCISEATRHDLESFMDDTLDSGIRRPWTRSVHLGCDLSPSSKQQPSDKGTWLRAAIGGRPYCAALGTIEPRKDYGTIIDAFESLWSQGMDVALVIIGKQGWNVEALMDRINQHPERNRRLFWLQGATDGDVRYLFEGAAALIQASIWEGFGLPLIEAGSLGVPLLVSDIAVFREIAGDGAVYFPVGNVMALAEAVAAMTDGKYRPPVTALRTRGWHEASQELAAVLCVA